jgi:hypothetical protein
VRKCNPYAADYGTWERVFTALMARADADDDLNWAVSVDSAIVRAHQHAAAARKKGPRPIQNGVEAALSCGHTRMTLRKRSSLWLQGSS